MQGADFPESYRGAIVVGRLGVTHHEGAGIAPQPAARAFGIGAVVGCGDVQLARGAVGELAMEVTVAVRHIGEVVTNVLSGCGDPDGDAVTYSLTADSSGGRCTRCRSRPSAGPRS